MRGPGLLAEADPTPADPDRAAAVAPPTAPQAAPRLPKTAPRLLFVVRGAESYGTETKILGFFDALTARSLRPGFFALGEGRLVERARALPELAVHVHPAAPPRFVAEAAGDPRGFTGTGNPSGGTGAPEQRGVTAGGARRGFAGGKLRAFAATVLASAAWMRALRRFLAATDYQALAICEHGLVLQTGLVARRCGVPAYWIMANGVSSGYRWDLNRRLYAFAFRHLNVIPVANSEYTRATLGRGARHAARIDLGVNPRRLAEAAPAVLAELPQDAIRLLVMSRLVPGKGHLVLLEALLSRPDFAAIHLILCGGPLGTPYTQALRDEAAAQGAADRLHLVGEVDDAAAWYALADVVVNARLDPEPFGLSIVEAMFCSRPVLAHAAGGPAEIVVDGVTGWHVTSPDASGFAAGLARMLADRARWPAMGQAGRRRAELRYTHDAMAEQFLAVAAGHVHAVPAGAASAIAAGHTLAVAAGPRSDA